MKEESNCEILQHKINREKENIFTRTNANHILFEIQFLVSLNSRHQTNSSFESENCKKKRIGLMSKKSFEK